MTLMKQIDRVIISDRFSSFFPRRTRTSAILPEIRRIVCACVCVCVGVVSGLSSRVEKMVGEAKISMNVPFYNFWYRCKVGMRILLKLAQAGIGQFARARRERRWHALRMEHTGNITKESVYLNFIQRVLDILFTMIFVYHYTYTQRVYWTHFETEGTIK